jgi:hypothetical protein
MGAFANDTLDGSVPVTTYNPVTIHPSYVPIVFTIEYSAKDRAGNVAIKGIVLFLFVAFLMIAFIIIV